MFKKTITNELGRYLLPNITKIISDFFTPIYFALYDTKDELNTMELIDFLDNYVTCEEVDKIRKSLLSTFEKLHDTVYEEACQFISQTEHSKIKSALESVLNEEEENDWLCHLWRYKTNKRKNWNQFKYSVYKMWARKIYHCLGELSIKRRFFCIILMELSNFGDKDNRAVFAEFRNRLFKDHPLPPQHLEGSDR